MEKNKSIDGLPIRRSKKTSSKTTRKVAPKSTVKTTSKTNKTPKAPRKTKSTAKPTVTKQPTPKPQPSIDATADFLSPVQAFNFDEENGELEATELKVKDKKAKQPEKEKKKKEKKHVSKARKIITSILLVIVLAIIGCIIWFVLWANGIVAKITGGQGDIFDFISFVEPTYDPLKTDANGRTNILAFGTSGYNMDGDEGNGVHAGAQLTDSIMVISMNQETGDIAMISLPRDLKASPTCTATGKINEVYWCNGGKGDASIEEEAAAAKALMNEVSTVVNLDFQYFAHVNWASLVQIVNILDGIKVTLDEGVYDYYYTKAVFDPGVEYTIDGEQALGLARARHGTSGGDFSRGTSQQKILIGIKNKLKEKNLSISDYLSLASTLGDNLRTNFSVSELKSLAHLASELNFDSMRQISLLDYSKGIRYMTTGNINGISYVLPSAGVGNYKSIHEYVAHLLSNDPRVYENPTILVLNGTNTTGVAGAEKIELEKEGFENVSVGNAPEGEYPERYTIYSLTTEKPGSKALLEKFYAHKSTSDPLPEGFPTDYDFIVLRGGEKTEPEESEEQ